MVPPLWSPMWPKLLMMRDRRLLERAVLLQGVRGVDSRKWRRRLRRAGAALTSDAEAFLSGRLAERLAGGAAASVPAWAWTNLLAHGTRADLRAAASRVPAGPVHGEERWRQARAYLAAEVLGQAGAYGSLARLQRDVLVPLELELATRAEVVAWWPAQWVAAVQRALHQPHQAGLQ